MPKARIPGGVGAQAAAAIATTNTAAPAMTVAVATVTSGGFPAIYGASFHVGNTTVATASVTDVHSYREATRNRPSVQQRVLGQFDRPSSLLL